MCIEPNRINGQFVACRSCWQCRQKRVNDLVGRCIAEQQHSIGVLAVTLTYAGETPNSSTLVYADFQKLMKRLRKAKFKVRQLVAGEYGTKSGRAHWHAVLFFKQSKEREKQGLSSIPEHELDTEMYTWKYWTQEHQDDLGYCYFQKPDYQGFAYAMKYTLKDQKKTINETKLSMSKYPPLGYEYFQQLAQQHVDQGLAPQEPFYSFPDVFEKNGERRQFQVRGASLDKFIEHYKLSWEAKYNRPHPYSEMIEEYDDKIAAREFDIEDFTKRFLARQTGGNFTHSKNIFKFHCPDNTLVEELPNGKYIFKYRKDGKICQKEITTVREIMDAHNGVLVTKLHGNASHKRKRVRKK